MKRKVDIWIEPDQTEANLVQSSPTRFVTIRLEPVGLGVSSVDERKVTVYFNVSEPFDWDSVRNKPNFAEVATSGEYDDLLHKPSLAPVATSGDYNDLDNRPVIPVFPTKLSDLANDMGFITNETIGLTHYYRKDRLYTKDEVDAMVTAFQTAHYEVVDELPEPSADTMRIIYIVNGEGNVKEQYISSVSDGVYSWIDLGPIEIDLTNYVTRSQFNAALETRPEHRKTTEAAMDEMLDEGTWEEGVLYFTVEE